METLTLPVASFPLKQGIFTNVTRAADGVTRWKATASDDGVDRYATRMTIDLYDDFIRNWHAGEKTFLTLAHFNQLARIGDVTAMYRDGRMLKAEGRFFTDSPDPLIKQLATAAADAALGESRALPSARAIKVSIGFAPKASVLEDLGVVAYTKGSLPEIAMTTHTANSRTDFGAEDMTKARALNPDFMEEDAASIVGADLAKKVREQFDEIEERAGDPENKDALELLYRADGESNAPVSSEAEPDPAIDPPAPAERDPLPAEPPSQPDPTEEQRAERPYKGPDDESLPANVKKLPEDQRKVWIKTFNAASDNGASDADAAKAANAFVKNMNAKQDKSAPDVESVQEAVDVIVDATVEERAGRKIQGKKLEEMKAGLDQMKAGLEAISGIMAWATEGDGEERAGDFREQLISRFTEAPELGEALGTVVKTRWFELTGNESISDVMDFNAMQQYLCMLVYTLQDLTLANLEPEGEMSMEQRLANIDNAIREFASLVSGIVSAYFSEGRSDNTAMNTDGVKPTGAGDTAPVKPLGVPDSSRDLTMLDDILTQMREVIVDGDRQSIQAFLNEKFAPVLEETVGKDDTEPEANPNEERMAAIEVGQAAIMETLKRIEERSVTSVAPIAKPNVPRRRGFTRPPAVASLPATVNRDVAKTPARFSIHEIAERGIGATESYP